MKKTPSRWKEISQEIISHLKSLSRFTEDEMLEINAVVSHWLHAPHSKVPFLTPSVLDGCMSVINRSCETLPANNRVSVAREPQKLYRYSLHSLFEDLPFPPPAEWKFTFVDLFAGIGGFRVAFQKAGGKCVFSSEWDKYAKLTYEANFGEYPYGDIRRIDKNEIPDHDVLCAGFPCQPFSLAGVSKKQSLGRKHGFDDETQGTLFFEIKEILRIKRPRAFMLENVKNLMSHDNRRTFEVIRHALEDQLGYVVNWKIVDGARWVPQHRERIFIVGYDPGQVDVKKSDIEIPEGPTNGYVYPELKTIIKERVDGYTLGVGTWATLERHKAHHAAIGNGFGYGMHQMPIRKGATTRTISARYHKDGAEVLIEQKGERPRRLTVEEAMRLQGFDHKKFIFPVSNTQAYKQIGNSVVVPAIYDCAMEIVKTITRG